MLCSDDVRNRPFFAGQGGIKQNLRDFGKRAFLVSRFKKDIYDLN